MTLQGLQKTECQNYQEHIPLPLISELLDKLKGARYFIKIDLRAGHNNVWIKDGDQWKAAFKTGRGLFEPTVMFFGMCNSSATFQKMMDKIIYMDDMFIHTSNLPTNIACTKKALEWQ